MNARLAKLLLIAFDDRCNDGERLAAINAAARMAGPGAIEGLLASSARQVRQEVPFSLGVEQQLEILQSELFERERRLSAAQAEIAQLRSRPAARAEDGLDISAVLALTGMSRATLYRRMAEGRFPSPCASKGTRKYWDQRDVTEWNHARSSR